MREHDGLVAREVAGIYKALFDRFESELGPAYRQHGGVPKSEVLTLCRSRKGENMAELMRRVRLNEEAVSASLGRLMLAGHVTRECVSMFTAPPVSKDRYVEGELFGGPQR